MITDFSNSQEEHQPIQKKYQIIDNHIKLSGQRVNSKLEFNNIISCF